MTRKGGSIMGFCKSWRSLPIRSWSGGIKMADMPGTQPPRAVHSTLSALLAPEVKTSHNLPQSITLSCALGHAFHAQNKIGMCLFGNTCLVHAGSGAGSSRRGAVGDVYHTTINAALYTAQHSAP